MFKKFFNQKNTVAGGAIMIALFSIFSRLLGLLRDRFLSGSFGAGNVLDAYFADQRHEDFARNFSKTIRLIFYLIIPTTVLFIALRAQIVRLILGAGAFSWRDTVLTAQTLGWFSASLFAQSLIPIFAKAFYAIHNTKNREKEFKILPATLLKVKNKIPINIILVKETVNAFVS
ncbi:unnamed protein product [marine sediment metagenome]|uniref:Murein biosynthesis integral membrane protein MurJ n=1 Tax=marine sediment metagenome TaxID=412755 RepID=X1ME75_9ZZZZ